MKNIIIVDTNFLINNLGEINNTNEELMKKGFDIYIPELVKDEFINIQTRKLDEIYQKMESFNYFAPFMKLKYRGKDESKSVIEDEYNKIFDKKFKDRIIKYNHDGMLERVLERNKEKKPPFYNAENSSDKGFKDTIILLSVIDFISTIDEETTFYFVTSDNGFIKYKAELEKEIFEKTSKKINILEGKEKKKLFKQLNVCEEEKIEENIFAQEEIDIDSIRAKLNDVMQEFTKSFVYDYYGNEEETTRFDVIRDVTNEETRKFLANIRSVIDKNIFSITIPVENFFDLELVIVGKYDISIETMNELYELYEKVVNTKYEEAFVEFITKKINENRIKVATTFDDDLPF